VAILILRVFILIMICFIWLFAKQMPKTRKNAYCVLKAGNAHYCYIFLIFRKVIFKTAKVDLAMF
ncbi:MAG TPA: hypothetical protein VK609_02720, partial [Mucilaginibacter sp.]|nr:hypothetical protein [Mucilaginibacter sp.]